MTNEQCTHLIATACTPAPQGHDRWTLRLLADKVVELGYTDSLSHETIRRLLKKHPETLASTAMAYSQGRRGVCWPMEDVLDLYEAPYDPARPIVCFDESPKQLIGQVREPIAPKPGTPAKIRNRSAKACVI